MQQIGVMAVVSELSKFMGDMRKVDSTIASIIPTSKLLGGVFDWMGGIISGFVGGAIRTLEYALGSLLSSAIQATITSLKQLGAEIIASTTEFQKMEVRLNRMNFNDLTKDEQKLGNAMEIVTERTREQLQWINKLAASTPFDAEDIARTYTLARTYGFAATEAQTLTYQISEFASGMGLTGTHIERIIQNFGQMKAAGKITGTEIRDLARGAFVPVNDILLRVADSLGITTDQLATLRQSGKTDAEMFFMAFSGLVEGEFTGAAESMNAILMVATENLKDMFKSMMALEVFKGLFEALAVKASGFQKAMFERWDEVQSIFGDIGTTLKDILTDIVGLTPSAETLADTVVDKLGDISAWLFENKDEITKWVKDASTSITDTLLPAISDLWGWLFGSEGKDGAIQNFGKWLGGDFKKAVMDVSKWVGDVLIPFLRDDLVPVFEELLPLGGAIADVFATAFGGEIDQSFTEWIHQSLIPGIENLTKIIKENEEGFAMALKVFALAVTAVFILSTAVGFLAGVFAVLLEATIGVIVIGLVVLVDWLAKVGEKARAFESEMIESFTNWISNTWASLTAWAENTWFTIIMWGINLVRSIKEWSDGVREKFLLFTVMAWLILNNWASNILASIVAWFGEILIKISNWGTDSTAEIQNFSTNALGTFALFGINALASIVKTFLDMKDEMWNKMKEIGAMLFMRAQGWILQIVNGLAGLAPAVIESLNDLISEIQAGINDITIGVSFGKPRTPPGGGGTSGGGGGGGVDMAATGTHGWQTVPPNFNNDNFTLGLTSGERYMVVPRGGQMSSTMAGSTVNSNVSSNSTYQLVINSSAPVEPIIQDFGMLSSMNGA